MSTSLLYHTHKIRVFYPQSVDLFAFFRQKASLMPFFRHPEQKTHFGFELKIGIKQVI